MGGYGSTRWGSHAAKTTVEQCLVIDAALWMREGIVGEGVWRSGTCRWTSPTGEPQGAVSFQVNTIDVACPTVRLMYTMPGTGELDYAVPLQTIQPYWGGVRWWFTCPLVMNGRRCGRRVQKLYMPSGCRYRLSPLLRPQLPFQVGGRANQGALKG